MFPILAQRLRQKKRTVAFPKAEPVLPDRFRGLPVLDPEGCARCRVSCPPPCVLACPTGAVGVGTPGGSAFGGGEAGAAGEPGLTLDLGRCTFCAACEKACPHQAVSFTREFRLSARRREDLILGPGTLPALEALDGRMRSLFGRSLKLREVSAGGCNACEADANVLTTVVFDLSRFGIDFVASPRHADGLYVTGPVPENMREALLLTLEALPPPALVIAAGTCAISGGLFAPLGQNARGAHPLLEVDLFIPGCPPHPVTALHGLLGLLDRL